MAIFRNLCVRFVPPPAGLEILQCMDACLAVFKWGGYNPHLLPLKARDFRLDLAKPGTRLYEAGLSADWLPKKTISFLDGHYTGLGVNV